MKKIYFAQIITLTAFSLTTLAQDKKIDRSTLPAAVEKTVRARTQGATVKGFATEVEHGKKTYEVQTVVNGHTRDLSIAGDGTLLEIEEEVAFDTLPTEVKAALTAKAAGAKIVKIESLTKKDKLVAYEAATLRGTSRREIQVRPDGKKLVHAE